MTGALRVSPPSVHDYNDNFGLEDTEAQWSYIGWIHVAIPRGFIYCDPYVSNVSVLYCENYINLKKIYYNDDKNALLWSLLAAAVEQNCIESILL